MRHIGEMLFDDLDRVVCCRGRIFEIVCRLKLAFDGLRDGFGHLFDEGFFFDFDEGFFLGHVCGVEGFLLLRTSLRRRLGLAAAVL